MLLIRADSLSTIAVVMYWRRSFSAKSTIWYRRYSTVSLSGSSSMSMRSPTVISLAGRCSLSAKALRSASSFTSVAAWS